MPRRALLQMLCDGYAHSAKSLAATLSVSIAELDQQIQELVELGIDVCVVSKSSYALSLPIELISESQIFGHLPVRSQDSIESFFLYFEVDSTNAAAVRFLKNGGQGRALFVAEQQYQGRGRRGNNWISPLASNIYLSFVLPCNAPIQSMEGLSLVAALSLVKTLQASSLVGIEKLQVKWPNDVWVDNKKLAGILLELHQDKHENYHMIIGIGVNVRMPASELNRIEHFATDLATLGNRTVNRNVLISVLIEQLLKDLEVFNAEGFGAFQKLWQQFDRFHRKFVDVISGDNKIRGRVKGVSSNGALILETAVGERLIMGGEIAPSVRVSKLPELDKIEY